MAICKVLESRNIFTRSTKNINLNSSFLQSAIFITNDVAPSFFLCRYMFGSSSMNGANHTVCKLK